MNTSSFLRWISQTQILSALIWALTIIACGWVSDKAHIPTILITAAGFHVIMMAQVLRKKPREE